MGNAIDQLLLQDLSFWVPSVESEDSSQKFQNNFENCFVAPPQFCLCGYRSVYHNGCSMAGPMFTW